jgi:hypothetical protein
VCSVAVVVRSVTAPPSWAGGSAGPGGGGGPLLVRHGPCLLPAGRALLLARPGRPGVSRWQPVQQATGRSARVQGSRARRRRRGRSPPAASPSPPTGQGPTDHPRPAGRRGQPPHPLPLPTHTSTDAADGPADKRDGRCDPNRSRLLNRGKRQGVVGEREGSRQLDRRRSNGWGGRTRRWMDCPAWMTQASPGWAWRTASGSMRGRSPIRALASPRGP